MNKKNSNLSAEQKLVMFEEGTEPPGSSELNNEKREGSYHLQIVSKDDLNKMKVVQVGHRFLIHFQMYLKQKQIIY